MAKQIVDSKGNLIKHNGLPVFASYYGSDEVFLKSMDEENRILHIVGSNETKDRDGDIIMVKGWDLKNYLNNPVFMWAHDYHSIPIARAIKVSKRKDPARLEFNVKFPPKELFPFADLIFTLYGIKQINTSSVGFLPIEYEEVEPDPKDPPKDPMAMLFCGKPKRFLKQELLELSGCAVPSNPDALVIDQESLQRSFGGMMVKDWIPLINKGLEIPTPSDPGKVFEALQIKRIEFEDEIDTKVQIVVPDIEFKEENFDTVATPDIEKGIEINSDEVLKPYPNEHACRISEPIEGAPMRRKNGDREHDGKKYDVIYQKKGDSWIDQAYRYPKENWTAAQAKAHCKAHDHISFEPASEGEATVDPPEVKAITAIEKIGAVLNRKNKSKLKDAMALIEEVLKTAEEEEQVVEPEKSADSLPVPGVAEPITETQGKTEDHFDLLLSPNLGVKTLGHQDNKSKTQPTVVTDAAKKLESERIRNLAAMVKSLVNSVNELSRRIR